MLTDNAAKVKFTKAALSPCRQISYLVPQMAHVTAGVLGLKMEEKLRAAGKKAKFAGKMCEKIPNLVHHEVSD